MLTESQEQTETHDPRGTAEGVGALPQSDLEGTVSRWLSQAKLKDLCKNLKILLTRKGKIQNATHPSKSGQAHTARKQIVVRRTSVSGKHRRS